MNQNRLRVDRSVEVEVYLGPDKDDNPGVVVLADNQYESSFSLETLLESELMVRGGDEEAHPKEIEELQDSIRQMIDSLNKFDDRLENTKRDHNKDEQA